MHDPTEEVQEHITHEAAHGGHEEAEGGHEPEHGHEHGHEHAANHGHPAHHGPRWITAAALTAAILAAFAAVSATLATSHLTESTLTRIAANDTWQEYGEKSIKSSNIDTRTFEYSLAKWVTHLPLAGGAALPPEVEKAHSGDVAKKAEYAAKDVEDSMPSLRAKADGLQVLSEKNLAAHETFDFAETMFHIAIAIVAIAVVAKRREFWYISMVCGAVGLVFFVYALIISPPRVSENPAEATTQGATKLAEKVVAKENAKTGNPESAAPAGAHAVSAP